MERDLAASAAELLERVANGELTAPQAIHEWPSDTQDSLLDQSWHDLSHFAADADIRERDATYRQYQVSLLRRRALEIREKFGLCSR